MRGIVCLPGGNFLSPWRQFFVSLEAIFCLQGDNFLSSGRQFFVFRETIFCLQGDNFFYWCPVKVDTSTERVSVYYYFEDFY